MTPWVPKVTQYVRQRRVRPIIGIVEPRQNSIEENGDRRADAIGGGGVA
jgi:hypothetical protein